MTATDSALKWTVDTIGGRTWYDSTCGRFSIRPRDTAYTKRPTSFCVRDNHGAAQAFVKTVRAAKAWAGARPKGDASAAE